jgi:hypothetical protein
MRWRRNLPARQCARWSSNLQADDLAKLDTRRRGKLLAQVLKALMADYNNQPMPPIP